jgi:hypothetical protein
MNAPELHGSGAFVQSSCITEGELVVMAAPHKRIAFYQKVLAMLCCCVVALGFVQPPRAHAIAGVDDAYMLVAAYLDACGLSWSLAGVDDKEEFAQAVADMVTSYTGTIGTTVTDWMTTITQASVVGGKLYLSKAQIEQLSAFANWLIGDKGITAGASTPVVSNADLSVLVNGVACMNRDAWVGGSVDEVMSTYAYACNFNSLSSMPVYLIDSSLPFYFQGNYIYFGNKAISFRNSSSEYSSGLFYLISFDSSRVAVHISSSLTDFGSARSVTAFSSDLAQSGSQFITFYNALLAGKSTTITINAAQAIDVPDTSTMGDDETLAIDVGATSGTLSDVLSKIWESIQAGTLAVTKAVVKGGTATGEVTDVNDLG